MSACQDQEELLTLHAAGALEPADEARVREHLASCAACRSEFESTARMLDAVALPPVSPAMRERMEALPQQTLSTWRRTQVRKAFRARTAGALLAAAAAVLVVVGPSLRSPRTPSAVPQPVSASVGSDTQADFEEWAAADPLGDAIDPASFDEDWGDEDDADDSASELFLDMDGESL
ncbi:anti-sigma factor family protein [Hyalangium versicolor]|uniref:anti-sigma factor family protein n=1 Tax=Hyalangium versicolor TaxID=2861190 RepID=UPI001CCF70DD|nr:zf-HC2 domain-containing protein [Hyalangium versicolor]